MVQAKWSSLRKSATTGAAVLAVVAGTVVAGQREKDSGSTKVETKTKISREAEREPRTSTSQAAYRQGELPEAYRQLDLDPEQRTQIQQALTRHDSQLQQTWNRFHQIHMQTVALEAAWIAALESQMTEEQQEQFREARRTQASNETTRGYRPAAEGTRTGEEARQSGNADRTGKTERNEREDKSGRKPASADSRVRDEVRDSVTSAARNKAGKGTKSDRDASPHHGQGADVTSYGLIIFAPEKFIDRKQMSPDKQEQCDRICAAYRQQIMSNWKQLHQLHGQLVQAESQKFAAIDEVLTERQAEELKTHRSQPRFERTPGQTGDEGFGAERNRDLETPRKPRNSDDN